MATTNHLRDLTPRQAPRESPFAGGFVLIAIATVVVGAIGVGGYALLSGRETKPDISDAVLAATGLRTTDAASQLEVDDGTWTDADLQRCDTEASAAAEAASKRKLAAVSANRVGLGAPDAPFVQRGAFLLCSVRNKPRHLCQSYWHNGLMESVKAYAKEFAEVRQSAYWTKVSLAEQARTSARVSQDALRATSDNIDETTRVVMTMHEEITKALRALVADGILYTEDFGVFFGLGVPPEVSALLGNGRAERHVCQ